MPDHFEAHLSSVAATIADYRLGEIARPDAAHISRWVSQFPPEDRLTILSELDRLLQRLYVSRASARELLRGLFQRLLDGRDPVEALRHVELLDLQTHGSSQTAMRSLALEVLHDEYGAVPNAGGEEVHTFIYLDDAIYTGNRVRHDLARFLRSERAAPGSRVVLFTLAAHRAGWEYAARWIERESVGREVHVTALHGLTLDNERRAGGPIEALWPREHPGDPWSDEYVRRLGEAPGGAPWFLFRDPGTPPAETFFSSPEGREVVERAFLRAGAFLALNYTTGRSQRPLGYEVLESLGFGSLFVTYRNIANNCPLALWWSHHPDTWYPLLPRRSSTPSLPHEAERSDDGGVME
ncbi:MAG: hypothetical protein K0Q72_906 [Armatimonadetes bacterium]|jgi:hypothetical protein|nr:hypothetical protein [Armatimonadota bacterium]